MSESDWVFFQHKWSRYQRQSKISGQQVIDEIWAFLDAELERLAFQDGIDDKNPEDLMKAIKLLAVTTVHPALHVVSLHETKQLPEETVKAFSARVRGVAKNCNLTKTCGNKGCNESVSFVEETCYHVVLTGIHDNEMKEKVLAQAMLGSIKTFRHYWSMLVQKRQQNRKLHPGLFQHSCRNNHQSLQILGNA